MKYPLLSKEQRLEFNELVKPLMIFLNDNLHPHTKIILDSQRAELVEGIMTYKGPN